MRHIHEIEVFIEVYKLGSFAAAASTLNATQPGISQCIKRLEADIGVRLFERRNNTIEPTSSGKRFFDHCILLLERHRSIIEEIRDQKLACKSLAIGVNAWMGRDIVASAIRDFSARFPHTNLTVIEDASPQLAELVRRGELSMAIASTHALGDGQSVFVQTPGVLVTRSQRDLDISKDKIDLIVPSSLDPTRALIESYLDTGVLTVARQIKLDSLTAGLSLVRASNWTIIVPELVYQAERDKSSINLIRLKNPPEYKLSIIYAQDKFTTEMREFQGFLKRAILLSSS